MRIKSLAHAHTPIPNTIHVYTRHDRILHIHISFADRSASYCGCNVHNVLTRVRIYTVSHHHRPYPNLITSRRFGQQQHLTTSHVRHRGCHEHRRSTRRRRRRRRWRRMRAARHHFVIKNIILFPFNAFGADLRRPSEPRKHILVKNYTQTRRTSLSTAGMELQHTGGYVCSCCCCCCCCLCGEHEGMRAAAADSCGEPGRTQCVGFIGDVHLHFVLRCGPSVSPSLCVCMCEKAPTGPFSRLYFVLFVY